MSFKYYKFELIYLIKKLINLNKIAVILLFSVIIVSCSGGQSSSSSNQSSLDGENEPPIEGEQPVEPDPPDDPTIEPDPPDDPTIEPDPPDDPTIEPDPPDDPTIEPDPPDDPTIEPDPPDDPTIEPDPPDDPTIEPDPPDDPTIEPDPPDDPTIEPDPPDDPTIEPDPPDDPTIEPDPPDDPTIEPDPPLIGNGFSSLMIYEIYINDNIPLYKGTRIPLPNDSNDAEKYKFDLEHDENGNWNHQLINIKILLADSDAIISFDSTNNNCRRGSNEIVQIENTTNFTVDFTNSCILKIESSKGELIPNSSDNLVKFIILNPVYLISSPKGMENVNDLFVPGIRKLYAIKNVINFSNEDDYVSSVISDFYGELDGRENLVTGLTIKNSGNINDESLGLIKKVYDDSKFKDLLLSDFTIEVENNNVGGVIGEWVENQSNLTNNNEETKAKLDNILASYIKVEGKKNVGGLIGNIELASDFEMIEITANVTGEGNIGGIIGNSTKDIKINDSEYIGRLNIDFKGENAGGLVGYSTNKVKINNVKATVDGILAYSNAGGLVGETKIAEIRNSYVEIEEIESEGYIGGLVGRIYDSTGEEESNITNSFSHIEEIINGKIGGLLGELSANIVIRNSYSTINKIKDQQYVGGIIGKVSSIYDSNNSNTTDKTLNIAIKNTFSMINDLDNEDNYVSVTGVSEYFEESGNTIGYLEDYNRPTNNTISSYTFISTVNEVEELDDVKVSVFDGNGVINNYVISTSGDNDILEYIYGLVTQNNDEAVQWQKMYISGDKRLILYRLPNWGFDFNTWEDKQNYLQNSLLADFELKVIEKVNESPPTGGGNPPGSGGDGDDNSPPGGDGGEEVDPPGSGGDGDDNSPPGGDGGEEVDPPGSGGDGDDNSPPGGDGGEEVDPPGSGGDGDDNSPPGGDGGEEVDPPGSGGDGDDNSPPGGDGGEEVDPPGSGGDGDDNSPPDEDERVISVNLKSILVNNTVPLYKNRNIALPNNDNEETEEYLFDFMHNEDGEWEEDSVHITLELVDEQALVQVENSCKNGEPEHERNKVHLYLNISNQCQISLFSRNKIKNIIFKPVFLISSVEAIESINELFDLGYKKSFALKRNINFFTREFETSVISEFYGDLDGRNFMINNLTINANRANRNAGFIEKIYKDSTINDILFFNITINGHIESNEGIKSNNLGIIAATWTRRIDGTGNIFLPSDVDNNQVEISNIKIRSSVINAKGGVAGGMFGLVNKNLKITNTIIGVNFELQDVDLTGGFIGDQIEYIHIEDSKYYGSLYQRSGTRGNAGGIIGRSNIRGVLLDKVVVDSYSIDAIQFAGGLIGISNNFIINNSYANIYILKSKSISGGLIGTTILTTNQSEINNSYANISFVGRSNIGGLIGMLSNNGILDEIYSITIQNSYSSINSINYDPIRNNEEIQNIYGGMIGMLTKANQNSEIQITLQDTFSYFSGYDSSNGFGNIKDLHNMTSFTDYFEDSYYNIGIVGYDPSNPANKINIEYKSNYVIISSSELEDENAGVTDGSGVGEIVDTTQFDENSLLVDYIYNKLITNRNSLVEWSNKVANNRKYIILNTEAEFLENQEKWEQNQITGLNSVLYDRNYQAPMLPTCIEQGLVDSSNIELNGLEIPLTELCTRIREIKYDIHPSINSNGEKYWEDIDVEVRLNIDPTILTNFELYNIGSANNNQTGGNCEAAQGKLSDDSSYYTLNSANPCRFIFTINNVRTLFLLVPNYLIEDFNDFLNINNKDEISNGLDQKYFALANDIILPDLTDSAIEEFNGKFDGRGHSILNINIVKDESEDDVVALFRELNSTAKIMNLKLEVENLSGSNIAPLVGQINSDILNLTLENIEVDYKNDIETIEDFGGVALYVNNAKVSNIRVNSSTNSSIKCNTTESNQCGGIFSKIVNSSILGSSVKIDIEDTGIGGLGGLAGNTETTEAGFTFGISDSNYEGTLKGANQVGGLVSSTDNINILQTFVKGELIGESNVGGFIGTTTKKSKIINSFFTGTIKNKDSNQGCFIGESSIQFESDVYSSYCIYDSYNINDLGESEINESGSIIGNIDLSTYSTHQEKVNYVYYVLNQTSGHYFSSLILNNQQTSRYATFDISTNFTKFDIDNIFLNIDSFYYIGRTYKDIEYKLPLLRTSSYLSEYLNGRNFVNEEIWYDAQIEAITGINPSPNTN